MNKAEKCRKVLATLPHPQVHKHQIQLLPGSEGEETTWEGLTLVSTR
jgi:hypothetical protein